MRKILLFLLVVSSTMTRAQKKISFGYDEAGNQKKREYCSNCPNKSGNIPKEITAVKPEDLQKFFPDDDISYYPNPVKEQLYIKWERENGVEMAMINVYSLNGQLIKSYKSLSGKDSFVVYFNELPRNVYSIKLVYSNGEEKPIKIIKE